MCDFLISTWFVWGPWSGKSNFNFCQFLFVFRSFITHCTLNYVLILIQVHSYADLFSKQFFLHSHIRNPRALVFLCTIYNTYLTFNRLGGLVHRLVLKAGFSNTPQLFLCLDSTLDVDIICGKATPCSCPWELICHVSESGVYGIKLLVF